MEVSRLFGYQFHLLPQSELPLQCTLTKALQAQIDQFQMLVQLHAECIFRYSSDPYIACPFQTFPCDFSNQNLFDMRFRTILFVQMDNDIQYQQFVLNNARVRHLEFQLKQNDLLSHLKTKAMISFHQANIQTIFPILMDSQNIQTPSN